MKTSVYYKNIYLPRYSLNKDLIVQCRSVLIHNSPTSLKPSEADLNTTSECSSCLSQNTLFCPLHMNHVKLFRNIVILFSVTKHVTIWNTQMQWNAHLIMFLKYKVFPYLTFSLNDPKSIICVKLPSFKIFLSLLPDALLR